MTRIGLAAAALACLGTAVAAAQPAAKDAPARPAQLYEDVEVMRRLLDEGIAKAYGLPVHGQPPVRRDAQPLVEFSDEAVSDKRLLPLVGEAQRWQEGHTLPPAEGVYLDGYGVVYSVTLPPPAHDPRPGKAAGGTAPPPLSPWDRTRKEVRGEKADPGAKPDGGPTPLADAVLHVLADNGRHFASLPEGEKITVAITFRGAPACTACHANPFAGDEALATFGDKDPFKDPNILGTPAGALDKAAPATGPQTRQDVKRGTAPEGVREGLLLGDLHLKQGKPKEAADAYQDALRKWGLDVTGGLDKWKTPDDVSDLMLGVELLQGFAKAKLALGEKEPAHNALQIASALSRRAEELTAAAQDGPKAANPAPASALPAKLVITAGKTQMDRVGAGKMSYEEFRQAATVEYLNAPAIDAAPKTGTAPPGRP
jgi:hypothetical protein